MKPFRLLAIAALLGIPVTAGVREGQGSAPAKAGEPSLPKPTVEP